MLPKKERLSRAEFNRFFSVGKRINTPLYQIVYTPHSTFHASVVVSKKIATRAVKRNMIRRRIYDILRRQHATSNVTGVFIFIVRVPVLETTYLSLKADIVETIQKIQRTVTSI